MSSSFLSSISVLTMRLLQDSSRPLCFWSLHQSWSSRYFFSFRSSLTLSIQVFLCLPLLLFPCIHIHVKLHLVVFSPPSVPRVQTTVQSPFSDLLYHCFLSPMQALLLFVHF